MHRVKGKGVCRMDPFDRTQVEAVWRRVQGHGEGPVDFFAMAAQEAVLAQGLWRINRATASQAEGRAACLRGMGRAVGQQESHRKPSPPSGGLGNLLDAAQMLENQYGQLQTHPAFGAVFTQLQQEAISLQRYLLTQMGR